MKIGLLLNFMEEKMKKNSMDFSAMPMEDKTSYKEIDISCAKVFFDTNVSTYYDSNNFIVYKKPRKLFGINPAIAAATGAFTGMRKGVFDTGSKFVCIDKKNHDERELFGINGIGEERIEELCAKRKLCIVNDTIVYIRDKDLVLFDMSKNIEKVLPASMFSALDLRKVCNLKIAGNILIYSVDDGIKAFYMEDNEEHTISNNKDDIYTITNGKVYCFTKKRGIVQLVVFDLDTKKVDISDTIDNINDELMDIDVEKLDQNKIWASGENIAIIGYEDYENDVFSLIDINIESGKIASISVETPDDDISSFYEYKNYVVFVEKHNGSCDLVRYDIEKQEKKVMYKDFYNFENIEQGVVLKKVVTEKSIKDFNMCGYWVMVDNSTDWSDDADMRDIKDVRKRWIRNKAL